MSTTIQVGAPVAPAITWQRYVDEVTNNLTFKTRARYHQDPGNMSPPLITNSRTDPGNMCTPPTRVIRLFPII